MMNNSRVKTEVNGEESDLFLDKIENLLQTATFNDISFNCKDGKISGNRLILSIYSNFLTSIFTNNPLIISHPLSDDSDNGINLTEVSVKDVSNLVNILNSGKCGRIKAESLAGLLKVAKLLKIELIKGQKVNGFVKVEAVPVLLENENEDEEEEEEEEEDDEKFDLKKVKVECEQSMVEGDESRDFPGVHENRFFREEMDLDFEEAKQSKGVAVCPVCNITCKSWAGMKRHVGHAHRHNKDLTPEERDVIICKCGLSFSKHAKRRVFREHRQKCRAYRNQGKNPFICELCKFAFDSMPALNNHQFVVHNITKAPRSCVCGETFKTKHRVRKHEITCSIYRSAAVMCKECDLPFLTEGHLKQHYRTSSHKNVTTTPTFH